MRESGVSRGRDVMDELRDVDRIGLCGAVEEDQQIAAFVSEREIVSRRPSVGRSKRHALGDLFESTVGELRSEVVLAATKLGAERRAHQPVRCPSDADPCRRAAVRSASPNAFAFLRAR